MHIDYKTLMGMPILDLEAWHKQVLAFHEERLEEREALLKSAFDMYPSSDRGQRKVEDSSSLSDFF